jgi:hypothetical protein
LVLRISTRGKILIVIVAVAALAGVLGTILYMRLAHRPGPLLIGAVMRQDSDPEKQQPLSDVEVTELGGLATGTSRSDSTGLFRLRLREGVKRGDPIQLVFRHPGYRPLVLNEVAGDKIYLAHLTPLVQETPPKPHSPEVVVSNVTVRYSAKVDSAVNVGSAVKTFEVVNQANVPCNGHHPCSPDGKWKATVITTTLDAGTGNEFRNIRVSCISGPCPFTKVDDVNVSNEGQTLNVTARSWSQTAMFLVEAEVFHPMISNINRQSYPVIFGRAMNFSLPPGAEGLSIQAEINGESIVFPLGPNLILSWAHCTLDNEQKNQGESQAKVYRCELKPGYRFG